MKKTSWITFLTIIVSNTFWGQEIKNDTIENTHLEEVLIINTNDLSNTNTRPLISIENHLKEGKNISMIQRGNYAWEPTLHSMSMERISLTIDGMHIFNACSDKMDPITSYIETSNLKKVTITSGQQGNTFGPTISGGIDLQTQRPIFSSKKEWKSNLQTGFESNSKLKIAGGNTSFSSPKWYAKTNIMFRKAGNYKAGKNEEILFSQYEKINLAGTLAHKLSETQNVETSFIYDKAVNIGYPALPMDVSLAEALITSLSYEIQPLNTWINKWETKLYFNTITHRMDDTKRPAETISFHMDMPGWSKTYGLYSAIKGTSQNHHLSGTLNAYKNKSVAEMTMYSNNSNKKSMFMYTWPDVNTIYTGLNIQDHWELDHEKSLLFSVNFGNHYTQIMSDIGFNSLSIFYSDLNKTKNRFLSSLAANIDIQKDKWKYGFGLAYGERAPSISEGYGYYIFNSSDKYDYIGNPNLKNEQSWEVNSFVNYSSASFNSKFVATFFHINNYILGEVEPTFSPMTVGALGVKRYINLNNTNILSLDWMFTFNIDNHWLLKSGLNYHYAKDNNKNTLPFISPLAYHSSISYSHNPFTTTLKINGNALKYDFAEIYGEKRTPSFAVLNLDLKYVFGLKKQTLIINGGIENILDTYYTTYADWNHIPRSGRNFYIGLSYQF